MGCSPGVSEIVDGHNFQFRLRHCRPEHHPADAAESVDTNFNTHYFSPVPMVLLPLD
jgi:hypothetical protein